MDRNRKIAEISKALGVDTRVKIIRLLSKRCLCVGALSKKLGITPGAVSQHLRVLRSAEVVISEKRGYFVHYCLNEKVLENWKAEIDKLFEVKVRQK